MATVGLKDLHYALLTDDSSTGVTYETPKPFAPAISANIQPTVNTANLNADDGVSETVSAMGPITVTVNTKDVPKEVQADLLGHTINEEGVLIKKSTDSAPYVAIGFRSEKADGSYRYVWLYKGKFTPSERNYETKQETPAFQTPTLNATFLRRIFDDAWEATVDDNDTGLEPNIIANWFNKVYEKAPVI